MDKPESRPILLVEDNPLDVDLTRRAFARQPAHRPIEVARDGEEALAWIPRWQAGAPLPQLVLLDIKLPKLSGIEVLRGFRAHPVTRALPVVVLSSSEQEQDIADAYRHHANSYIVKPLQFEKFIDVAAQIELYWCFLNHAPR